MVIYQICQYIYLDMKNFIQMNDSGFELSIF